MFWWLFTQNWRSFNQRIAESNTWSANGDFPSWIVQATHDVVLLSIANPKQTIWFHLHHLRVSSGQKRSFHESWNHNSGVSIKICSVYKTSQVPCWKSLPHSELVLNIQKWSLPSLSHISFLTYLLTSFCINKDWKQQLCEAAKNRNPLHSKERLSTLARGKNLASKGIQILKHGGSICVSKLGILKSIFFKTICRGFEGVFFILKIFIVCLAVHDETFLAWFAHITIWKGSETPNCDLVSRPPSFWSFWCEVSWERKTPIAKGNNLLLSSVFPERLREVKYVYIYMYI